MPPLDPLPPAYHFFFTTIEPALTLGGVVYAVFTPVEYHQGLIPESVVAPQAAGEVHPSTVMAVRQLGSCFFLLALLASVFLRRTAKVLAGRPELLEPVVASYLFCLGLADWTHILFTFYDLGLDATLHPFTKWNTLVWGNCGITLGLFAVRAMWWAGWGRAARGAPGGKKLK